MVHLQIVRNKLRGIYGRLGQKVMIVGTVVSFGVVGALILATSHAGTIAISLEPESGAISVPASSIADTTASLGRAVTFQADNNGGSSVDNCPGLPAYPDATCTGVPSGTHLVVVDSSHVTSSEDSSLPIDNLGWHFDTSLGAIRVDSDGAVFDGVDVTNWIEQFTGYKSNVIIKNSRFRCEKPISPGAGNTCVTVGNGPTISNVEIGGGLAGNTYEQTVGIQVGDDTPTAAITTIKNVHIHHVGHALHIEGQTTLTDSYIHDMAVGGDIPYDSQGQPPHTDGIFIEKGSNITIRHNHFARAGNNSDIFVQNYESSGPMSNLTIADNFFEAGSYPTAGKYPDPANYRNVADHGVGLEDKCFNGTRQTVSITNNVFSTNNWNRSAIQYITGSVHTGNKYQDGTSADANASLYGNAPTSC